MSTTVHLINHTHWDREWFLTSVYTSRWIPGLIDKLEQLAAANPSYRFLFDGQTLVMEDLLAIAPAYGDRVKKLIADGQLSIGPYYSQPDWQLTDGELLIRNLLFGRQDLKALGGASHTGWLVDTFGHISQAPQIHRLFQIEAVYVWRGVPRLTPYFQWLGPDNSDLFAINLFGGYRNLYGITHAPEVALARLQAEVDKLRPYYPTPDIPLFDGYDLEDDPEDPLAFYQETTDIGSDLRLVESTPAHFAAEIMAKGFDLPTITGELNSGKYGATFPGTFSARTYLKVMARDCKELLLRRAEPLGVLARLQGRPYPAATYASLARILLQNAVHDCICGVSIDQVHEKMEYSYRQVFDTLGDDIQASMEAIFADFLPGQYTVSTTPFATDQWQRTETQLVHVRTEGIGVWPVVEQIPIERPEQSVAAFRWCNDHYEATVDEYGAVRVGAAALGMLLVHAEQGDTYSDETGASLGVLRPNKTPIVEERSAQHVVLRYTGVWQDTDRRVSATIHLGFDASPLIRWQINLDSRGTDLAVQLVFKTNKGETICAGMPFDVVERPLKDTDLLPRAASPELANILMGQRELNAVSTFPFHDFVAVGGAGSTLAVFAKGLHTYAVSEDGTLKLTLRRSVEWVTKTNLSDRVGDAGPFFYVPDARCERQVQHEVAVVLGPFAGDGMELQRLNAAYQTPPLVVEAAGRGEKTGWRLLQENVPLSSLQIDGDAVLARFYNPTAADQPLEGVYRATDVQGKPQAMAGGVGAKMILTACLAQSALPDLHQAGEDRGARVQLLTPIAWRVGENAGRPDVAILADLETKMAMLESDAKTVSDQVLVSTGNERLRLQHRYYVLKRESLELQLSLLLNRRKLAEPEALRHDYLYQPDEEIARVGLELNRLRIKRRIFDYVVATL